MILRGGKRHGCCAIAERKETGFLTFKKFLDDDFRARLAKAPGENFVDGGKRLIHIHGDDDAFACGEPVGLDDNRRALFGDEGFGGGSVGESSIGGGRNVELGAEVFGVALGAFKLRGSGTRSEGFNAFRVEPVDKPCDQRVFRSYYYEVDVADAAKAHNRVKIERGKRHTLGNGSDAAIARCAIKLRDKGTCRDLPAQRMFAATRANDKNVHGVRISLWK